MPSFLSLPVFDAYEKIAELTIEDSIKNELSGDFERLMLAVGERELRPLNDTEQLQVVYFTHSFSYFPLTVQCIRSVPMFFAKRLYKSMKVHSAYSHMQYDCSHTVYFLQRLFIYFYFFNSRKFILTAHICSSVF